jgi:membrane protein implicated in regulation of membrane protease activity
MIDNAVRWLLVGGLSLLGAGVCLLGIAVLASGLFARFDGYLLVVGAGFAVFASWASWQFLLVIAAIVLLAAGLGLAWTASRVTPDGRGPNINPD